MAKLEALFAQLKVAPPTLEQHLELVQFAKIRRTKAAARLVAAQREDAAAAEAETRAVSGCEDFVAAMAVPAPVTP